MARAIPTNSARTQSESVAGLAVASDGGRDGFCAFETFEHVSDRRKAAEADRVRGRRSWADGAPTGAAQGTTGERAKAAILWRREGLSAVYDRLPTKFFSALCLVATIGHRFD